MTRKSNVPAQFAHFRGHAWKWSYVAVGSRKSVDSADPKLELYENGHRLGPAHADHETISVLGRGAFFLSQNTLYFSTSDNSNPNANGRQYDAIFNGAVVVLGPSRTPAYGYPIGRDPFLRNTLDIPIPRGAELGSETEKIEALHRISMLHRLGLARLRAEARRTSGAILEIGSNVGGATCAMADAVRDQRRKIISVEVGGPSSNDALRSRDIIADLQANLAAWGVGDDVEVIADWLHCATNRIEASLAGRKVGLLLIDADGKISQHMMQLVPFLSDDCVIALDDYLDPLKGSGVKGWVERALANGSVEQIGLEEGGLWLGRVKGHPQLLPVTPFIPELGHCWLSYAMAPHHGPDKHHPGLTFTEDGRPLGPGDALHAAIRYAGHGRFSVWAEAVYLSTSDNSDPNTNGRLYAIQFGDEKMPLNFWRILDRIVRPTNVVAPPPGPPIAASLRAIDSPMFDDYLGLIANPVSAQPPVNLQSRTKAEVAAAAEYSVRVGKVALDVLAGHRIPATGSILEIGPGWDFGSALLLGEHSRRLIVADRFLARWQPEFHMGVYREMQRILGRPSYLLDEVVRRRGHDGVIEMLEEPAFDLKSLADNSMDLVYSNAVLEHTHPLDKVSAEIFRITRSGGRSVHQVDFRYHRSFDHPLEHLLFTREEYDRLLEATHCEVGCQTRVKEAVEFFEQAGFEIVKVDVNITATESYMQEFMPRLGRCELSPYREWQADELAKISARLFMRRP